jgi:hypothetical protein
MVDIEHIRQRSWDFALTIITVVILASLGVQSFVGTIWVLYAEKTIPGWEQGAGYANYVSLMNTIAAPQVLALVVVMGLCVPKRLFSRRLLIGVSAAMIVAGGVAGAATSSLGLGLAVYLGLAAVIQVAVVVMTVAGVRGPSYLTEGRLTKTGSGLLHLGFIVFGIVIVALQSSTLMLPVFSASAVLVTVGTAMAFYSDKLAWHRPHGEELGFSEAEELLAEEGEDIEELEMPEAWP